jgi:hypothetical protein
VSPEANLKRQNPDSKQITITSWQDWPVAGWRFFGVWRFGIWDLNADHPAAACVI